MPHMTARQAAVQALLKVDGEGGYSNLVLNEQLKKAQLSPEDTAFASRLFYGTLERKLTLDHIIGAYSKKPVHKLTPAVAEILRMSLYQLAFLDSVPDSAAVNEGVKLTRTMKAASASGFVNAVLRAFLRDGKELPPIKGGQLLQGSASVLRKLPGHQAHRGSHALPGQLHMVPVIDISALGF